MEVPKQLTALSCGASPGASPLHMQAARDLARVLHENQVSLVYGGGTTGLMGELARHLVTLSGPDSVHGIIPAPLVHLEHDGKLYEPRKHIINESIYGRTTTVEDMHTRKEMMFDEVIRGGEGGGFIALSGGYGTLEELMEITTWNQLAKHSMPVIMYNVNGYWAHVIDWIKEATAAGFVDVRNAEIVQEAFTANEAMEKIKKYEVAGGRFDLRW